MSIAEDTELLGRTPPNSVEAEQVVLGSMMLSTQAIEAIVGILQPEHFYRPTHQMVYAAICHLYGHDEPTDALAVHAELQKRKEAQRVGGAPYLFSLVEQVPVAISAAYFAKIVAGHARRRRLIEAGQRITEWAYSPSVEVPELEDRAGAEIFGALDAGQRAEDYVQIGTVFGETLNDLDEIGRRGRPAGGVPTGLADLDRLLHGLQPHQMIVVAARPAIGKSLLGLNFARSAAIVHDVPTVIFSLEMSRKEIAMRLLSAEARVALHNMQAGQLSDDDWLRLARRMGECADAPLFVDDSPNISPMQIRAKCREIKRKHGLGLVVVDYLQLMKSPGIRSENRQQEVSEISRSMKLLAKELEVPVVAISQLNRGPEQRADHIPMVSDLRESGSIEQDADVVILLHREDAYERESPRAGEADIIVAKHRGGPTATVTVAMQGHYARFVDMATL